MCDIDTNCRCGRLKELLEEKNLVAFLKYDSKTGTVLAKNNELIFGI